MAKALAFIMILALIVGIAVFLDSTHRARIQERVEASGGTLISCETRVINHPFWLVGRGDQIYHFTYDIGGQVKEGWVKFSLIDDWKM